MSLIFHQTFEQPLGGYPYYKDGFLIFSYTMVDDEEETGEWGVAILDLDHGTLERYPSPFKVDGEILFPEDISWSLNGSIDGFFIFLLSWETSYEKAYQCVKWDRESWYVLDQPAGKHLSLSKDLPFRKLEQTEIINSEEFCLSGGTLHPYQAQGKLNFSVDDTHAFEHDSSPTVVNESYKSVKAQYPAYHSNLEWMRLLDYKKSAQLPEGIPAYHPALDKDKMWDMKVAQYGGMLFLFFDSYSQEGILDVLIFKE